ATARGQACQGGEEVTARAVDAQAGGNDRSRRAGRRGRIALAGRSLGTSAVALACACLVAGSARANPPASAASTASTGPAGKAADKPAVDDPIAKYFTELEAMKLVD